MAAAVDRIASYPRRSCLSVPGHAVRMHEKALMISADEVVFDLEDAVALGAKQQAREAIAATLVRPEWAQRTVAVRVNPWSSPEFAADLDLVGALRGKERLTVVVPKVEAPDRLLGGRGPARFGNRFAGADRDAGWDRGGRSDRPLDTAAVRADPRLCGLGGGAWASRSGTACRAVALLPGGGARGRACRGCAGDRRAVSAVGRPARARSRCARGSRARV